ncbi:MAG: endolytic transglycosylase MltG [Halorhodospira sp.]
MLLRCRWRQLAAGIGTLCAAGGLAVAWLTYEVQRPLQLQEAPQRLEVPEGASLGQLAREMEQRGWLSTAGRFGLRLYGRLSGIAGSLQTGEYAVEGGVSAYTLLQRIAAGRVIQHRLTVVEGWTFERLREALRSHDAVRDTLEGVEAEAVMDELGLDGEHPEGLFYPTTYRFPRGTTDRAILRRAYRRMEERLETAWEHRQPGLPLETAYEVLILASIIERETAREEERRRVAGVLIRRLERGMRLQSDPSVIYGVGDTYEGRLRWSHLRNEQNPYNTYRHHGLPPTPIALPGSASLRAAVDPEPGDALYFVSRGDGTHQFSATLEEHNKAVRRYILEER